MHKLLVYIQESRKKGFSEQVIKDKLKSNGYPEKYIDKAFILLKIKRYMIFFILVAAALLIVFLLYSVVKNSMLFQEPVSNIIQEEDCLIKDDLSRDICFFESEACYSINSTYLRYSCLRMNTRNHLRFMASNSYGNYEGLPSFDETCEGKEGYSKMYCNYLHAASNSLTDINSSIEQCLLLADSRQASECLYYVSIPYLESLSHGEMHSFFIPFCNKMPDNIWKSECFFAFAEELSKFQDTKLPEIADACKESSARFELGCTSFISAELDIVYAEEFCNEFNTSENNGDCYYGIGMGIGNTSLSMEDKIGKCTKYSSVYEKLCLEGMINAAAKSFGSYDELIMECGKLPEEFYAECIDYIGFSKEFSCEGLETAERENCLNNKGNLQFFEFRGDLSKGLNGCFEVSKNLEDQKTCFNGVLEPYEWGFSELLSYELKLRCSELPEQFIGYCMGKIS